MGGSIRLSSDSAILRTFGSRTRQLTTFGGYKWLTIDVNEVSFPPDRTRKPDPWPAAVRQQVVVSQR
jgi:hypothetical protein